MIKRACALIWLNLVIFVDGNGIKIPSVFVGWSDGRLLQTDYCYFCTDLGTAVGK